MSSDGRYQVTPYGQTLISKYSMAPPPGGGCLTQYVAQGAILDVVTSAVPSYASPGRAWPAGQFQAVPAPGPNGQAGDIPCPMAVADLAANIASGLLVYVGPR